MSPLDPKLLLDAPITFDVGGQLTHAPMVEIVIAGSAIKLILDTGSTDHILTTELTDRLGLAREPGEAGTDSVGASIESWSIGELGITIGELPLALHGTIAIAGPPPFEGWGIGGFLSPQHLHPTAHMILDLVRDRLVIAEGEPRSVADWVAKRAPDLVLLTLDRAAGDSTVLVHAAVDAHEPVVTMLDSGGKRTEFVATVVPGATGGERRSSGRGVGGGEAFGSEIQGVTLRLGGIALSVPSIFIRDEMGNAPGLVGMDVLRGTVLVVRADPAAAVLWFVPRDRVLPGG